MEKSFKSNNEYIANLFKKNYQPIQTGFYSLNCALGGGFFPAIYVLGGAPGIGKTTLANQIADNAASDNSVAVIYCDLQNSRDSILCRSLARFKFQNENRLKDALSENYVKEEHVINSQIYKIRRAKLPAAEKKQLINDLMLKKSNLHPELMSNSETTAHQIQYSFSNLGDFTKDSISKAALLYEKTASNIYFFENITKASEIIEKVQKFITENKEKHVILFVDFIQLLQQENPEKEVSDKERLDNAMFLFKKLSIDYQIPVFLVSAVSRFSFQNNNYNNVTISSFKESGLIEYLADFLFGLESYNYNGVDCLRLKILKSRINASGDILYFSINHKADFVREIAQK